MSRRQRILGLFHVARDGVTVPSEEVDTLGNPIALLPQNRKELRLDLLRDYSPLLIEAGEDGADDLRGDSRVDEAADLGCPVDQVRVVSAIPVLHPTGVPAYLRRQVEMRLRHLDVDRVDLLHLHRIDPTVSFEDQIGELKARPAGYGSDMNGGPESAQGIFEEAGKTYRLEERDSEQWRVFDGDKLLGVLVSRPKVDERGPLYSVRMPWEGSTAEYATDDWKAALDLLIGNTRG